MTRRLITVAIAAALAAFTLAAPAHAGPATLKVLTFNLWFGGSKVDDGRAKQLKIIRDTGADVVGLQEHMGTSAQELARELGWYHHAGDNRVGIISRYPITEREHVPSPLPCCIPGFEDFSQHVAISARIRVGGQDVEVWNTHHPAERYGPYSACFEGWPTLLIEAQEQVARGLVMRLLLDGMRRDLAATDTTPVVLVGDFNAPSHLDYTPATANRHCGYSDVNWPSSRMAADAGLADTFRVANPDPAKVPGDTWSPITPQDPQDRIDFVYRKGALPVVSSRVIVTGDPRPVDDPDVRSNEWPSDHAAVLTTFRIGAAP